MGRLTSTTAPVILIFDDKGGFDSRRVLDAQGCLIFQILGGQKGKGRLGLRRLLSWYLLWCLRCCCPLSWGSWAAHTEIVAGCQVDISASVLRLRSGTIASSAGYPIGKRMYGRSFSGRPRIVDRNAIGLGVCVSVAKPILCKAMTNNPHAIPTLSLA